MPGYTGIRRFEHEVLTKTHAWTVHEYKEIMKVIIGALIGLCPTEGIHLVMQYLDIHQLAHYSYHTGESLAWLENIVDQFFEQLKSPNGPFIKYSLVSLESETQKDPLSKALCEHCLQKRCIAFVKYRSNRTPSQASEGRMETEQQRERFH